MKNQLNRPRSGSIIKVVFEIEMLNVKGEFDPMKMKTRSSIKYHSKRRTKEEIKAELPPLSLFARNRREELGYSQEDLAFRSGLSSRFIKEFERGKTTARLDKVIELLEFMGATLEPKLRSRS